MIGIALLGLFCLVVAIALVWIFGPRAERDGPRAFDRSAIGGNVDAYLHDAERSVPNLRPAARKHVVWRDPARKARTGYSIVYIHGFSASHREIRPVPDLVGDDLDANIFFTRLTGHGQDGAALAGVSIAQWRDDVSEALEIGRRIGERVIVMGTSTGGTLLALGLAEEQGGIAGAVFVSPNFALKSIAGRLLNWPFAQNWLPVLAGRERMFVPANPEHGEWWTTRYPSHALFPLAGAVAAADSLDYSALRVPALFMFSDEDRIVDASKTRTVAGRWGGPSVIWPVRLAPRDDRDSHVIAGDILSPGSTDAVTKRIVEWVREQGL